MEHGTGLDSADRMERVVRLAQPAALVAAGAGASYQVARALFSRALPGWLAAPLTAASWLGTTLLSGRAVYQVGSKNPDPLGLEDSFVAGGAAGAAATFVGWLSGALLGQRRGSLLGLLLATGVGFLVGAITAAVGWVFAGEPAEERPAPAVDAPSAGPTTSAPAAEPLSPPPTSEPSAATQAPEEARPAPETPGHA